MLGKQSAVNYSLGTFLGPSDLCGGYQSRSLKVMFDRHK